MRLIAATLLLAFGAAPIQCASDPDPNNAVEDTPGEALYLLAEKFRQEGDQQAASDTLRHLIERYPSSRFAKRAALDLEAAQTARAAGSAPSDK